MIPIRRIGRQKDINCIFDIESRLINIAFYVNNN